MAAKGDLTQMYNNLYQKMQINNPGFKIGILTEEMFGKVQQLYSILKEEEPTHEQALFGEFGPSKQEIAAGVWSTKNAENSEQIFVAMQVLPLGEGATALPLHVHNNSWRLLICLEGAAYAWGAENQQIPLPSLTVQDLQPHLMTPGMYIAFPEGNHTGEAPSYAHSFTAYDFGETINGGLFLTLHGADMLDIDAQGNVVGSSGEAWTIINNNINFNDKDIREQLK